ncbi:Serine/arginine-rich splicing factor 7 [Nymphon striatum]|nr:Serine/arginine-rich splicing factor 7 [Nymphon striatum]
MGRSRSRSRSRSQSRSHSHRRSRSMSEEDDSRLHIADLGTGIDCSKREIERVFEKYGKLREVWLARNPPCFAFVVYDSKDDADEALRHLDGTMLCGGRIRVTIARPRTRGRGRNGWDPNMRCYQCGEKGHFSRDCVDTKYGYRRPPTSDLSTSKANISVKDEAKRMSPVPLERAFNTCLVNISHLINSKKEKDSGDLILCLFDVADLDPEVVGVQHVDDPDPDHETVLDTQDLQDDDHPEKGEPSVSPDQAQSEKNGTHGKLALFEAASDRRQSRSILINRQGSANLWQLVKDSEKDMTSCTGKLSRSRDTKRRRSRSRDRSSSDKKRSSRNERSRSKSKERSESREKSRSASKERSPNGVDREQSRSRSRSPEKSPTGESPRNSEPKSRSASRNASPVPEGMEEMVDLDTAERSPSRERSRSRSHTNIQIEDSSTSITKYLIKSKDDGSECTAGEEQYEQWSNRRMKYFKGWSVPSDLDLSENILFLRERNKRKTSCLYRLLSAPCGNIRLHSATLEPESLTCAREAGLYRAFAVYLRVRARTFAYLSLGNVSITRGTSVIRPRHGPLVGTQSGKKRGRLEAIQDDNRVDQKNWFIWNKLAQIGPIGKKQSLLVVNQANAEPGLVGLGKSEGNFDATVNLSDIFLVSVIESTNFSTVMPGKGGLKNGDAVKYGMTSTLKCNLEIEGN